MRVVWIRPETGGVMYDWSELPGWHVPQLRTTLRVGNTVELMQHWSVVADATLDELVFALVLGPDATVGALYGGEIVEQHRPEDHSGLHEVILRLPEPILPGDAHACALFATSSSAEVVSSYFDVVAAPCDTATMHVRFLSPGIPTDVWRVEGVDPLTRPDAQALTEEVDPGGDDLTGSGRRTPVLVCNEAELSFRALPRWSAHGLAWRR